MPDGMQRLGQIEVDAEDESFQPMRIVSSDEQNLPVCFRHRIAVFASGVLMTLIVVVVSTYLTTRSDRRATPPPMKYTIQINLTETERYRTHATETHSASVSLGRLDNPAENITRQVDLVERRQYHVEKLCGSNLWSFMRFRVENYTRIWKDAVCPGDPAGSETTACVGKHPSPVLGGEQVPLWLWNSNLSCVAHSFACNLQLALKNRFFMAKLGHDGGKCQREDANVVESMDAYVDQFLLSQWELVAQAQTPNDGADTAPASNPPSPDGNSPASKNSASKRRMTVSSVPAAAATPDDGDPDPNKNEPGQGDGSGGDSGAGSGGDDSGSDPDPGSDTDPGSDPDPDSDSGSGDDPGSDTDFGNYTDTSDAADDTNFDPDAEGTPEGPDMPEIREDGGRLLDSAETMLRNMGQDAVDKVQHAIFPFLQASPPGIPLPTEVEGTWDREAAEALIKFWLRYKLEQVQESGSYMVDTSANTFSLKACEPSACPQSALGSVPTADRVLYITFHQLNFTMSPNGTDVRRLINRHFPHVRPRVANLNANDLDISLRGALIVHARTGVVLHGKQRLEIVLRTRAGEPSQEMLSDTYGYAETGEEREAEGEEELPPTASPTPGPQPEGMSPDFEDPTRRRAQVLNEEESGLKTRSVRSGPLAKMSVATQEETTTTASPSPAPTLAPLEYHLTFTARMDTDIVGHISNDNQNAMSCQWNQ